MRAVAAAVARTAAAAAAAALSALLVAGLAVAVTPATSATAATAARSSSTARGGGGCNPYINGTVVPVPCSSGNGGTGSGGTPGSPGSGGGTTVNNSCTMLPISKAQATGLGLAWPPPKGKHWALMECVGGNVGNGPQAVLVNNVTGAPQVTPQQLLVQALRELKVPTLSPATAPPRGRDGLVGLPEWFWVPAGQWHARSVTVTAGPVWATATAAPLSLSIDPGAGLGTVGCAGPGVAYRPAKPAARQHTSCSYTYTAPSAGLPGDAYHATITVTWRISWTGSGGAGGVLDQALTVPDSFAIPVAQGEALVTSP